MSKIQHYKEVLAKSGAYGLANLFARAAGMLLLPVYTRYMSPTDYGVMDLLDLGLMILALFFGMRLGEAMLYEYSNAASDEQRQSIVSSNFLTALALGAVILPIGSLLAAPASRLLLGSNQYHGYVRLALLNMCVIFPSNIALTYLRGLNKSRAAATLDSLRCVLMIGLTVLLMVRFHMTVAAYLWATVVGTTFEALYVYWPVLRRTGLRFDVALVWREIKYSFPLVWSGIGLVIVNFGDRAFLRHVVGLSEIGIYALAYKFGLIVNIVQSPFELYWRAQAFAILKRGNAAKLYAETCTYLILVLMTVTTGLIVFLKPIVRFLVGPGFNGFEQYVPWIAVAYLIKAVADYFRTVMRTENQTRHEGTIAVISTGICVAAYAVLIPAFHVWGAVVATDIAFASMLVSSYYLAQKVKQHDFEWPRIAKIVAAGAIPSVISQLLPALPLWMALSTAVALMAVYLGILIGLRFFSDDEIRLVRQGASRLRQKSHIAASAA
jgi:O-antigen/teichoic acid export membrane protein